MKKIPIPMKTIPMALEESFTPAEMLTKICFKLNEIVEALNNISPQYEELKEYIDGQISSVNVTITNALTEAKTYTDARIAEELDYNIIRAGEFDNLHITAEQFDNMNITAYQYDTESGEILRVN